MKFAIDITEVSKKFEIQTKSEIDCEKRIFYALKKINIQIPKGRTIGIIGKNGSGKSTLLKILSGVIGPSSGKIVVEGKIAAVLKIGAGFHPDLSGRENIFFYGSMMGMSRKEIKDKLNDIVAFSELEDFINEPIKNYSDGMYLRLAFSVVVHANVDIILFDEVLAVGDNAFNIKSFSKIKELKKNKTIVLVSHNMDDIVKVCDECIWIEQGEVKSIGSPSSVVSKYMESNWLTSRVIQSSTLNSSQTFFEINRYNDDKSFFLQSVKVKQLGEKISEGGGISYNSSFCISLRIKVLKSNPDGIFPSLLLFNHNETPIMVSSSLFSGYTGTKIYNNGEYLLECIIGKQLLNMGIYKVQIYFFDYEEKIIFKDENSVMFKITSENEEQQKALIRSSFSVAAALDWKFLKM